MEHVTCVRIHRAANGSREYDAITVHIADLALICDLVNDRQIRLANRLAVSHGAELRVSNDMQERVMQALDVRPDESRAMLSADDSKGGNATHVIGAEPGLMRDLVDALAARCGTNAEEWPLIERARRRLDGVQASQPSQALPELPPVPSWVGEDQIAKFGQALREFARHAVEHAGGAKVTGPVPREPTEAMLAAVRQRPHPTRPDGWDSHYADLWRRMWDAARAEEIGGSAVLPASVTEQPVKRGPKRERRVEVLPTRMLALIDKLDGYLNSPEQIALADELRAALGEALPDGGQR
jgi:hypothetical protein